MQFNNKTTRNVADAAAKILAGQTVSEEKEQLDELSPGTLKSYIKGARNDQASHQDQKISAIAADDHKTASDSAQAIVKRSAGIKSAKARLNAEDVEQIEEGEKIKTATGYRHVGTYGTAKGAEYGGTDWDQEEKDAKSLSKKTPARRKYGARQNYVRSTRVNEFTDLLNTYKEGGLKQLSEAWAKKKVMKEEPTNDEFTKEVEEVKKKAAGTAKQANVAAAASQACTEVKESTHTEIQVIDMTDPDNIQKEVIDLEERSLTAAETDKKEEIVKSMKKNLAGFKERYGKDAKSVMYATATKQAMKEEQEDHWQKGYDHVREPISDEPYLDNARVRFNELKKNNPHKKGTQEHKDWHAGASTAYEEHKDMLRGN